MGKLQEIAENLIAGEISKVTVLTQDALSEGISAQEILNNGLIAGMNTVGKKFKADEMFLPEVLLSAQVMLSAVEILEPALAKAGVQPFAKIILGTVQGDIHSIGKNLVRMMLQGAGFKVIDIGVDVSPERFVDAVRQEQAQMICMSALLTTTMPFMKTTIEALKTAGLDSRIKTLIGGAVVNQEYAEEIGADGYAPDAASAVDRTKELLSI
ncbi:corrinoid protein [Chloroflexota bacterium]